MMATDGYHFFADELGAFHWDNPARVMRSRRITTSSARRRRRS